MVDTLGDGVSSVELIDHMGSDLTVVNAARVSFHKESHELSPGDYKLIHYLATHGHWTPFAQPQLQFRIKMPIFVARQWYKSTVGFTRNEVSRRYVTDEPQFYTPKEWRRAVANKKQGSTENAYVMEDVDRAIALVYAQSRLAYDFLIGAGVAPEMARMILPQSMYTEFIETGSLYAYARMCGLRLAPDAQAETRAYARAVWDCVTEEFPASALALGIASSRHAESSS